MKWRTEILAGTTTFFTMAYIAFVNPAILSSAGVPFEGAFVATCITAAITTILMGLLTNYPFALAAGMGLNAMVAFTIVGAMGESWQVAMACIFIEGVLVTILVLTNVRELIMNAIPLPLKFSIGVGIGIFLSFIGLQQGGLVVNHPVTLVTLGNMALPYTWVTLFGLFVTSFLVSMRFRGSLFIGILVTLFFAIILGVAKAPTEIIKIPTDFSTFFALDIKNALKLSLVPIIFALFMTDFFDTMGTVVGLGEEARFLSPQGKLPRLKKVLLVDSLGAVFGGLSGSSSNTTYIESAAGIADGGRTGKASIVTGILFLLALFLSPVVAIVGAGVQGGESQILYPVTAPALIIVGFFMMASIKHIDFSKYDEAIPAFLTMLLIPLTYQISVGIGVGFISYILIKVARGKWREVHPVLYPIGFLFGISFFIS